MTRRPKFSRTMTWTEIDRDFTRLELRHASNLRDEVRRFCSYCSGHSVEEVAERIGLPKTLVRQLLSDDDGRLLDAILWQRRQRKKEEEQQKEEAS